MIKFSRLAAATAVVIACAAGGSRAAAPRTNFEDLAGRWSGVGQVEWKSGRREPYQCVVTYYLGDGGASMKQQLRCKNGGTENKLDLATAVRVNGGRITGTWEDRLYSMTGTVSGKVTPTGYEADASNAMFRARFEIEMASACEQSVTIRPSRDIEVITALLKKC